MRKAVAAARVFLLAALGASVAAPAPTLQSLVDGARQDGQLSIVAGDPILAAMNRHLADAQKIVKGR